MLQKHENLSHLSAAFIQVICNLLDIKTQVILASSLVEKGLQKNERNIDLCLQMGARTYLSGQGAKKYNDENLFAQHQLKIVYQSFELPVYKQIGEGFVANLSVLDMLFNVPIEEIKKIIEA